MNNQTKIPNDFFDKYLILFKEHDQIIAVIDLIKQSYKFGYEDGSNAEYDRIME